MDKFKRVSYALWFTLVFLVILNICIRILLDNATDGIEWAFITTLFLVLAYSFQDLAISHIMGGEGLIVKPFFKAVRQWIKSRNRSKKESKV